MCSSQLAGSGTWTARWMTPRSSRGFLYRYNVWAGNMFGPLFFGSHFTMGGKRCKGGFALQHNPPPRASLAKEMHLSLGCIVLCGYARETSGKPYQSLFVGRLVQEAP